MCLFIIKKLSLATIWCIIIHTCTHAHARTLQHAVLCKIFFFGLQHGVSRAKYFQVYYFRTDFGKFRFFEITFEIFGIFQKIKQIGYLQKALDEIYSFMQYKVTSKNVCDVYIFFSYMVPNMSGVFYIKWFFFTLHFGVP